MTATLESIPAQMMFAGLAANSAGLYQFDIVVPALNPGSYPLVMNYQGMLTQTGPLIAVQ